MDIKGCFQKWARLGDVNENLSQAYIKKALNDLLVLGSIPPEGREWKAATAYYARYHMLTALLHKIGVVCKDHNCTITIAEKAFSSLPSAFFTEVKDAKKQRILLQYYTTQVVDDDSFEKNINSVRDFVRTAQDLLESLTREQAEKIRNNLEEVKQ